jgi:hypothetical protein
MTKKARDHTVWTNKELEADPAGYRAARDAHREDQDAAERKRRYDDDLARFTEAFVAAGGDRSAAPSAFKAARNEQAAAAAQAANVGVLAETRQRAIKRL